MVTARATVGAKVKVRVRVRCWGDIKVRVRAGIKFWARAARLGNYKVNDEAILSGRVRVPEKKG